MDELFEDWYAQQKELAASRPTLPHHHRSRGGRVMANQIYTKENCPLCKYDELEYGDTLYQSNSWDGGICYDSIYPVRFCPLCGRELPKEDDE